jgi:hypothetical protein
MYLSQVEFIYKKIYKKFFLGNFSKKPVNYYFNKRRLELIIIKFLFKRIEFFFTYFLSLKTRKVNFSDDYLIKYYDVYSDIDDEFAIIMQGPLIIEKNFTYNTLKLYRYKYPRIRIVLSTWLGQDREVIVSIRKLGVNVIENEMPANRGIVNVNLQIFSTKAAIIELKKFNVNYILKVRSDQRNCINSDFLSYMRNLQIAFPLRESSLISRLIIISANTFRSRLYGITDMLMFGHINDMEKFWCIPLEGNDLISFRYPEPTNYIKNEVGEGYLIKHFFKSTGFIPNWSSENSLEFIIKYFCIIDNDQLDFFWLKYDRYFESFDFHRVKDHINWERINFIDWVKVYSKFND